MLELSVSGHSKRNWFGRGRNVQIQATLKSNGSKALDLGRLTEEFLQRSRFIQSLFDSVTETAKVTETKSLRDMRGRPAETLSSTQRQQSKLGAQDEEIFFGGGELILSGDASKPEPTLPFSYALRTHFDRSEGVKHIVYRVSEEASDELRRANLSLSPKTILRLVPARLDIVRLGCELFRPHFLGSSLGFTPSIAGRFYLELLPNRIELLVQEDGAESANSLPLQSEGLLQDFSGTLSDLGLYTDLKASLSQELAK